MTIPLWAALVIGLGGPALAALAAVLAVVFTRRSAAETASIARRTASELEARAKREETGVNVRAALTLACSVDEFQRRSGIAQLQALNTSGILNREQQALVAAQLRASLELQVAEVKRLEATGEDVKVSQRPAPSARGEEG